MKSAVLLSFIANWLFVLGCCIGLGFIGWPIIAVFRGQLNWALLATPLAGLLILPLSTLAFYVLTNVAFARAAVISVVLLSLITLAALIIERPRFCRSEVIFSALVALVVTSIVTWIVLRLSIEAGEPTLQYFIGSDHLGYASVADWLAAHPVTTRPRADPRFPYESFPQIMGDDPRGGTFAYLGLISLITGEDGTFSYDRACAVVLAAGTLSVSAAFSRSRIGLTVLLAGLLVSHWYDYDRTGFLGKSLAYPGMMLVVALTFAMFRQPSVVRAPSLVIAAVGAAIALSGVLCAAILAVIGMPVLLTRLVWDRSTDRAGATQRLIEGSAWLAIVGTAAGAAIGVLARPEPLAFPDFGLGWDYVLPRALDIQHQGPAIVSLSAHTIAALNGLSVVLAALVAVLAWRRRAPEAFALIATPLVIEIAVWLADIPAVTMQLMGLTYPLVMCGMVSLAESRAGAADEHGYADTLEKLAVPALSMLVAVVMLGMRVPRLLAAVSYYAGAGTPAVHIYKRSDVDHIADAIGTRTAKIDISYLQAPFLLLLELTPRGIDLQWTPRAWKAILLYRGWDPPTYAKQAEIRIVSLFDDPEPQGEVILRTNQYVLLHEPK